MENYIRPLFEDIKDKPTTIAGYGITDAFSGEFNSLTGKPTTIAGYGITDAFNGTFNSLTGKPSTISGYGITDAFDGNFSSLTNKPTTIAGYGITDAFDSNFNSLTNKPTTIAGYGITDAFDSNFNSLTNKPTTIAGYGITDAFDGKFSSLTNKPTTISGYGITDAFNGTFNSLTGKPSTISGYGITDAFDGEFNSLTNKPTTIAGYGITDVVLLPHDHDLKYPSISELKTITASADGWYTIATLATARAYGEFFIYDDTSSCHSFIKLSALSTFGINRLNIINSGTHSLKTVPHVRMLWNTANRTYGGTKLQIYCQNAPLLYIRSVFTENLIGWEKWSTITPILENTPSGWTEDSDARINNVLDVLKRWDNTNHGTGSGLDADLLDGNHASAFALSAHNHAWSSLTSGIPDTASRWPSWSEVTSKPSTFEPSAHNHDGYHTRSTSSTNIGLENTVPCIAYVSNSLMGAPDGALYSHVYSNEWKHQIQGDYRTGQISVRGKNNGTWQPWRQILDSSNYTSYAPQITYGTTAGTACQGNDSRLSDARYPALITVSGDWNNVLTTGLYQGDSLANQCPGSSWRFCIVMVHNSSWVSQTMNDFNGTGVYRRNRSNGVWSAWKHIIDSSNHTSYAPQIATRDNWNGRNAISQVAGQIAWKNYGDNHTIFDASNSTSPNGISVNSTNPGVAWSPSYPTLMGWNGANTYGVRVDSCRIADSIRTSAPSSPVNGDIWIA